MDRRILLLGLLMSGAFCVGLPAESYAKDGNSGGGNSGSGKDDDSDDDDDDDDDKDDDDQDEVAEAVQQGDIAPISKVLQVALAHTPGKVIDVKIRRRLLGYVYRVKILARTGRKRELHINAKTLKILKVS